MCLLLQEKAGPLDSRGLVGLCPSCLELKIIYVQLQIMPRSNDSRSRSASPRTARRIARRAAAAAAARAAGTYLASDEIGS